MNGFYLLQIFASLTILTQHFNTKVSAFMSLYTVFMGKNELIILRTILLYFLK